MAMVLNSVGDLPLLEHRASAKVEAGMWGALGETSHVINTAASWQIEPTGTTLLRGMKEELNIDVDQKDLRVPARQSVFGCEWPVGTQYPGQLSNALCPIVEVSPSLERAILRSRPSSEIMQATFTSLDTVNPFLRPGMINWLKQVRLIAIRNEGSPLNSFAQPDWIHSNHPNVIDAILGGMFDIAEKA